jgi:hypothetical protein
MGKQGYVEEQVRYALRRLSVKRLIEIPHAHYRELQVLDSDPPERFYYRATSAGLYHVRYWAGSFAFLDAMSIDTPIFDQEVRQEVASLASSFEIANRYRKTTRFRSFLEEQWHLANIGATYFDFAALLAQQEESF